MRQKTSRARRGLPFLPDSEIPDDASDPGKHVVRQESENAAVRRALAIIEDIKNEAKDEDERHIIDLLVEKEIFGRSLSYASIGTRATADFRPAPFGEFVTAINSVSTMDAKRSTASMIKEIDRNAFIWNDPQPGINSSVMARRSATKRGEAPGLVHLTQEFRAAWTTHGHAEDQWPHLTDFLPSNDHPFQRASVSRCGVSLSLTLKPV